MQDFFVIAQGALSVFLVILILIQPKGTGLGKSVVGSAVSFTRRGLEKVVFRFTFIITGLFMVVSVFSLIL